MPGTLEALARDKRYDEVLARYADHPDAEVLAAAEALREDDAYRMAISLYEHLLEHTSDPAVQEAAHFGLGQCAGKVYDYDRALEHLRRAFAGDRTQGAAYYAYILERQGHMDEADRWYTTALQGPEGEDLWTRSHRAWFLEKWGRDAEAEAAYRDVLERNPGYTWAVKRYAMMLLRLGRAEESRALMDAAAERFPASPFVKVNELEYRLVTGGGEAYEQARAALDLESLPVELQVFVALLDYVERELRHGRSDPAVASAIEERAAALVDSVHRDVDDLTELLARAGADLEEWQRLVGALLK